MDYYDEFGNYIGPALDDDSDVEPDDDELNDDFADEQYGNQLINRDDAMAVDEDENRIVLHEDKNYYPDASEVYPGVRTVVLDEDAQDLSEPIIKPIKPKVFSVLQKEAPALNYDAEFVTALMNSPNMIRNVAVIGQLHHGKTIFLDTLVQTTHVKPWDPTKDVRYTDTRKDEQERELSVKSTTISLVLENLKSKSFLLNIIDCPGHINFCDETAAALRAVDGVALVVDAVEGVMMNTERVIKQALRENLPICLVIAKMDRLILELKLPPEDAYYKLCHIIEEVNRVISTYTSATGVKSSTRRISPERGNVCFAAGQHGWSFTLESFAVKYLERHPSANFTAADLAKRLWGDWYLDEQSNSIRKSRSGSSSRSFIAYVLQPLYKMYAQVIGETAEDLSVVLKQLKVRLSSSELHLDPRPLLRLILSRFFGPPYGFVEMVTKSVPSPVQGAANKVDLCYTGYQMSEVATLMRGCVENTPSLMMNVVKLYSTPDGSKFWSLARIYSGRIETGQKVRVLGEGYTQEDDEDAAVVEISAISVSVGRWFIEVTSAVAGNLVLLEGVDAPIKKTATIVDVQAADPFIFKPLAFDTTATMKLAVEPFHPSELPKMVEALRRINKSYPLVTTKVEESGEHVLFGTGELYLDCVMHDLRHLYSDIEVKVADPFAALSETVVDTSALNCFAETPNHRNRFTMVAEPLDTGLADDIERGAIRLGWDKKAIGDFFTSKYDWDFLSSRSIWAFGPESDGPNVLLDNTLPSVVDKGLLSTVRESMIQGFKWGCREGPLCDETIRNTKFKILDATIANEPIHRGGGQVIPTTRRAAYSAFLMASPKIMEPVLLVEIQAPADCVKAVYPVLARRRGHVVQDAPKPGTPFYTVKAFLPVIDSFGFETDLRSYTLGQAFCQQTFDHWAVVPGDPLDRNVILHPLEPSPPLALARDFMIKTRRRKGLSEDINVNKYFDASMLLELAKHEAELGNIF